MCCASCGRRKGFPQNSRRMKRDVVRIEKMPGIGRPMSSSTTSPEPAPEMVAYYEQRTYDHIERVGRCLLLMAMVTEYGEDLSERAKAHDKSKFGPEERLPYIWLTEFHR